MLRVESLIAELAKTRRPIKDAILPSKPGVYAIYLSERAALPPFAASGQLLYVGKSESSLNERDIKTHFDAEKTGHSTFRRSLGAILKEALALRAVPRGPRRTKQDFYCYRFTEEGEKQLTDWMLANLEIGYVVVDSTHASVRDVEEAVMDTLQPPLNLDPVYQRKNPHAERLSALRKLCADEARCSQ